MFETNYRMHTRNWNTVSSFLSFISRPIARWMAARRHERAVQELYSLPNYLLRDIGLDRYQIHDYAERGRRSSTLPSTPAAPAPAERNPVDLHRDIVGGCESLSERPNVTSCGLH
ncbi:DUF1127 domain-containing protein [Rhizobium leguminosarum]|uniref:DUF1127 domain-containing protein n=1 Tax=Rhizobium leguminosarum TaxID=384 RepID=UPI003F9B0F22